MSYQSVNPYTGEKGEAYVNISDHKLESIIDSSQRAFLDWRDMDIHIRTTYISALAEVLKRNIDQYASTITSEMGKPLRESIAEIEKCAFTCEYYAKNGPTFLRKREMVTSSGISHLQFDPLGVILAVMPWNFPFWQVIRCIIPAILAGNAVLLKHASNVPQSAVLIEKALIESGFPVNLFSNLFISHKQIEMVLMHKAVRSVSLTGSNSAGETIAKIAGANIKKCVLELGGSDPFIVFPDADISKAVDAAIIGRFQNSGQSCIATKRIFLHDKIFDEFTNLFIKRVEQLKCGDPKLLETDIGPMVNRYAAEELETQVAKSVGMGAEIIFGAGRPDANGSIFRPTVMINVPNESPVAVEETFGPVVPLFRFKHYSEMVDHVNSSRFGLAASVWTNDNETASRVSTDINSGSVTINGFSRSDPSLPFGGVKDSGYGRELSDLGLYEFVNIKSVTRF
jgi:succinate-semialdehyde dehydrogenase/glutarate-semialdehyde dehydrogenase